MIRFVTKYACHKGFWGENGHNGQGNKFDYFQYCIVKHTFLNESKACNVINDNIYLLMSTYKLIAMKIYT